MGNGDDDGQNRQQRMAATTPAATGISGGGGTTMSIFESAGIATCIGCSCTDINACYDIYMEPCHWLRVNRETGKGVCSECSNWVPLWDAEEYSSDEYSYKDCCCYQCPGMTPHNTPDCACEDAPVYDEIECGRCPKKGWCDVPANPHCYHALHEDDEKDDDEWLIEAMKSGE